MAQFFVVYIERVGTVSYNSVKEKMNLSRSWYRLSERTWILCSTSDVERLNNRFAPLVKPDGSLFVCKLDIDIRQGWMNEKFWEWVRKHNDE